MALIKRNTAYSVNDIVNTKFGVKLKCTTAGTTSTDTLILNGTSYITDGTVVWEVQEEQGGSGQGSESYSTTEQEIGTWIGGEKLYRKVFENVKNGSDLQLPYIDYDIKKIYGQKSGDVITIIPNNSEQLYLSKNGELNTISTPVEHVVVEYTKLSEQIPKYLLRLRANENGVVDLAGNTINNHNVAYTASGKFGGNALIFNGTNSYLDFMMPDTIDDREDFTFSAWVLDQTFTGSHHHAFLEGTWTSGSDSVPNYPSISISMDSRNLSVQVNSYTSTSDYTYISYAFSAFPNVPYHLAVTRERGQMRVAINGVFIVENSFNRNITDKFTYFIGYNYGTGASNKYANFILDDICLVKGKALWSANFTPPSDYLPDLI